MPAAILLSVLVPSLIEQLGKTVRLALKQRRQDELQDLRLRVEALELKLKWST